MTDKCAGNQADATSAVNRGTQSTLFKALGDERRLRMLDMVAANPGICACNFLEVFDMSPSTLSHHMGLLKKAGLVTCEKRGKWCHYTLSEVGFSTALSYCDEMTGARSTSDAPPYSFFQTA